MANRHPDDENLPEVMGDLEGEAVWKKVKGEHLPYFVKKFSALKPKDEKPIAYVEEDSKLVKTFEYLDWINTAYPRKGEYDDADKWRQRQWQLAITLENFGDDLFYAFRKLLEILFHDRDLNEKHFNKHDEPQPQSSLTSKATKLLATATVMNLDFSQRLCEEPGLLMQFVSLLEQDKDWHLTKTQMNKVGEDILRNTLRLLYNCSMHDKNRQHIIKAGGLKACLPYRESLTETNKLLAFFCVAYLESEKQSENFKVEKELIQGLVKLLKSAINHPAYHFVEEGLLAEELAKGLGALSRNDANKKLIIDCGAIDVLLLGASLHDAGDKVKEETMKVLLTLSFHIDAKALLEPNTGAMKLFAEMASTAHDHKCKKEAEGILRNLGLDAKTCQQREEQCKKCYQHIMISYHESTSLVSRVKEVLVEAGYKVRMEEHSPKEIMEEAVKKSAVFLMCISKGYEDCETCQSEAKYAETHTEIIPLLAEAGYNYKPDGWLGILIGSRRLYDITKEDEFDEEMQQLKRAVGDKGKETSPHGCRCEARQ